MARRKSISFSAKPLPVGEGHGRAGSSLNGAFIPAAAAPSPIATAPRLCLLGRAVYGAVYALSFGCVFGTMLIGRLVPGREIIARGIIDGAQAARQVAGGREEVTEQEQMRVVSRQAGFRA